MVSYQETKDSLKIRLIDFSIKEYLFAIQTVLGEDARVAYASVFDADNFEENIKDDDDSTYLDSFSDKTDALLETQQLKHLVEFLRSEYERDIQENATQLSDFKFTNADVKKLLNNLLRDRSKELSESSVKDILSIVRTMEENGALGSDDNFAQHFITVPAHYNALCPECGHELYAVEGLDIKCPHCGQVYKWSSNRFYPALDSL